MNEEIIRIDLGGVNCYLVKSNGRFVLFDTGGPLFMDKHFNSRQNQLLSELDKVGCNPDNLNLLVLTHGDLDHVFNAAYIRGKYKSSIAIHHGDLPSVENPNIQTILENCQYRSGIYKFIPKITKGFIKKVSKKPLEEFKKFSPDIIMDENFNLLKYGLEAKVVHLPGHTTGSIGILFDNGSLICGDIFSNMSKPNISPNAYDFRKLDESIKKLNKYDINTVYPGHGNSFLYNELRFGRK